MYLVSVSVHVPSRRPALSLVLSVEVACILVANVKRSVGAKTLINPSRCNDASIYDNLIKERIVIVAMLEKYKQKELLLRTLRSKYVSVLERHDALIAKEGKPIFENLIDTLS